MSLEPPPNHLVFTRLISSTRRREAFNRLLKALARGLALASAACVIGLAADRWLALSLHWSAFAAVGVAILATVTAASVLTTRPRWQTARRIDRTLRLHDQISSADALFTRSTAPNTTAADAGPARWDTGFAALLVHRADALASRIRPATIAPIRFTREWSIALLLTLVFAAGYVYVPARQRLASTAAIDSSLAQVNLPSQRDQDLARDLASLLPDAAAHSDPGSAPAASTDSALDPADDQMLKDLAAQLAGDDTPAADPRPPNSPEDFNNAAAAKLNALADKLQQQGELARSAGQALDREFSTLDAPSALPTTREFLDSLKAGDLAAAAESIQQMLDQRDRLPESQRSRFNQDLRDLARQLRDRSALNARRQLEQRELLKQTLGDMGLPAEHLLDQPNDHARRTLEHALRNSPQAAQKLADELENQRMRDELSRHTMRDLENLADALERGADAPPLPAPPPSPPDSQPHSSSRPPKTQPPRSADADQQSPASSRSGVTNSPQATQPQQTPPARSPSTVPSDTPGADQREQNATSQTRPDAEPQQSPRSTPQPSTAPHPQAGRGASSRAGEGQATDPAQHPAEHNTTQDTAASPSRHSPGAQSRPADRAAAPAETNQHGAAAQPSPASQPADAPQHPHRSADNHSQQPGAQPHEQRSHSQPSASQSPSAQQPPLDSSAERRPSAQHSNPAETPKQSDSAPNASPQELLRQLAERAQKGRSRQETSQKLRDMAQRLVNTMSDDEKKKWAQHWARENQQHPRDQQNAPQNPPRTSPPRQAPQPRIDPAEIPPPGRADSARSPRQHRASGNLPGASADGPAEQTREDSAAPIQHSTDESPLDLRGSEQGDQRLFRWLDDHAPADAAGEPGPAQSPGEITVGQARQAVQAAERAVNQSAAPARYHALIKRFFGRLAQSLPQDRAAVPAPQPESPPQP